MSQLASLVAQYGMDILLEHTHTLAALIETDGRLLAWNPPLEALARQISTANTLQDFIRQDSRDAYLALINAMGETKKSVRENISFVTNEQDGQARYDCVLLPLPDGRALFFAELAVYDHELPDKYHRLLKMVTSLEGDYDKMIKILMKKQIEIDGVVAQADEVSHTDALTYLPNRRKVINDLQHEVMYADRYKTPLSISMLDVDHFKRINDTYGHSVGDEVLRNLSTVLQEHVRTPDIVGRYGGEEFLILLPNSSAQAASEQAMRLCKQIREHTIDLQGSPVRMTVSIGIAEYRIGLESWDKLLSRADAALYQAKNNGRDRWAVADK